MRDRSSAAPPSDDTVVVRLLKGFSLEMTGKDVTGLERTRAVAPAGTRVNVTFLGNEGLDLRVAAAEAVAAAGLVPVPHLSARRLESEAQLDEFLARLSAVGAAEHVFAVGGDPARPEGPYPDALSLIESGLLPSHGVKEVGLAGYPEGHPDIPTDVLWRHLEAKCSALEAQGLSAVLLTQFAFDTTPVTAWIREVRSRGIVAPIRIGTPGPAGVKRLISFARRFGIGANAMIVKKYGFSLTNLMGTAGPDRFIAELAGEVAANQGLGEVGLHFYTFGGVPETAEWVVSHMADRAGRATA